MADQGTKRFGHGEAVLRGVEILKVNYEELASACGNWNDGNKIGEGGFGQIFKGVLKHQ